MCLQHLEPWLASNDGTERERGSVLLMDLLEAYQKQYYSSEVSCVHQRVLELCVSITGVHVVSVGCFSCVSCKESGGLAILGHLLGQLVPRATDPQLAVRQSAIHCIQVALRVGTCEKGMVRCVEGE